MKVNKAKQESIVIKPIPIQIVFETKDEVINFLQTAQRHAQDPRIVFEEVIAEIVNVLSEEAIKQEIIKK